MGIIIGILFGLLIASLLPLLGLIGIRKGRYRTGALCLLMGGVFIILGYLINLVDSDAGLIGNIGFAPLLFLMNPGILFEELPIPFTILILGTIAAMVLIFRTLKDQ